MILDALTRLLEPQIQVVGCARNGPQAIKMARLMQPDLLVLDISMPELDGIEVARQLLSSYPAMKILMLSFHHEAAWVRAAFEAGASGYLSKTSATKEIETAVGEVLAGNVWISPAIARVALDFRSSTGHETKPGSVQNAEPSLRGEGLTPRELEILELLAISLSNKEIARRLGVSVTTIRTHLSSAYQKLGVDSRVGLALYAAQLHREAS